MNATDREATIRLLRQQPEPVLRDFFAAHDLHDAFHGFHSQVSVEDRIRSVLLAAERRGTLPQVLEDATRAFRPLVFIVHGHDEAIKDALELLLTRCLPGAQIVILHQQPNQGRMIIQKFEDYAAQASFAVVLLTGDDTGSRAGASDVQPRARQNVIFELGYFVGKLGLSRVVALYQEGVELPSDYAGIAYTILDKQKRWRHELARELDAAGLDVDFTKVPYW